MRELTSQEKKFRIVSTKSKLDTKTDKFYTDYTIESETDDITEVQPLLNDAFDKTGFEIYYTRCALYEKEHYLWFDYGSHSKFIELHFKDSETYNEYMNLRQKQREAYEASKNMQN